MTRKRRPLVSTVQVFTVCYLLISTVVSGQQPPQTLLQTYCYDCHDNGDPEGGLNLREQLAKKNGDFTLIFEKLITGKMPPEDVDQPSDQERMDILQWVAKRQVPRSRNSFRRISRHEFNYSLNDLLGIELDLTDVMADDRGTNTFDSDRSILLTREMLTAYFSVADQMLDFAFPLDGFLPEFTWTTNKLKDSHSTYNVYTRPYRDGTLFSWTRANNGNSYSFFYDGFAPPVSGWYEFTFDAAKVGDFPEDVTIQVHAGKYYFADDRPQPQRLIDVISLRDKEVKSYSVRGFFNRGESVSVHCYSRHTFRKKNTTEGAYIQNLKVRGPLHAWPPRSYSRVFKGMPLEFPKRLVSKFNEEKSVLERIGGSVSVSSFQEGMEKERMLDGSNQTFWHTRFSPDLAKPPHYVIFKHPGEVEIAGLKYSTWSGGNGNGQVKAYEIYCSDDGKNWGTPIVSGRLETRLAAEQPIMFPTPTRKRYIKFFVKDFYSIDGRSLASIGRLDVMVNLRERIGRNSISVVSPTAKDVEKVIRRFAQRAFAEEPGESEMATYYRPGVHLFNKNQDFMAAVKLGLKTVICSRRFVFATDVKKTEPGQIVRDLARTIWLSVPDQHLRELVKKGDISGVNLEQEIERMLADAKSKRMIRSFCNQWLNLKTFKKVSPSLKLYPLYDDLLDYYLPLETEAFLRHLIVENLPSKYLIDSDFSFLNQRLAQHYEIEKVYGQELRKIELPENSQRGGLLTMGSILKVTTDGFDTSPILRGAWVSKNIVGNTLSPPPESVKAIEPDTSGARSLKEQIEHHKTNESCASCHRTIDPYGFALENFDATGQKRMRYRVKQPHRGTFQYRQQGYFSETQKVETSGEIGTRKFKNIVGLKKILLDDPKTVSYNFMKKFFEFANGYPPTLEQRLELFRRIPADADECRLGELVKQVLIFSFGKMKP